MKNIFKISSLLLAIFALTCCRDAQEIDTAQYSKGTVKLVSFGPNPIMRGAPVRFFGSNLDRIVNVEVPGIGDVDNIEVVETGERSEIRVNLPSEGTLPGKLTLVDDKGKKYTTQVELTYVEPIVFDSFKANEPAFPGDVITFSGDYMNLVKAVIFEGGAKADVQVIDRHNAKAIIPAEALSGKVCLSDEGEIANLLYSEAELTMGEPKVKSVSVDPAKPGNDLTISGEYLNMIQSVKFAGETVLGLEELSVASDNASLTLTLPATAQSGDVIAISYAGKEYTAGSIEMVVPTELAIEGQPLKAGSEVKITGKDLDIVTSVNFPSAEGVEYVYADGVITLNVPATATEGDVSLNMANGDVVTVAVELVHPTVTKVAPVELKAGENIVIEGTDLDLITSATLGGKPVAIVEQSETSLSLVTENTSVSGKIVLTLANAETIEPSEEISLSYDSLIIVTEMPSAEHIGAMVTLKGANFMMIESIYIGEEKVTTYVTRTDEELSFIMPYNKIGTYSVKFRLISGDEETCPRSIEVLNELDIKVIWEGNEHINWTGMQTLAWGGYDWSSVKKGTLLNIYYTLDESADYWQLRPANGSWSALPSALALAPGEGNVPLTAGSTCLSIALTAEDLDVLINQGGLVLTGANYTLTKIELATLISQETTIWSGSSYTGSDYQNNLELGGEDDWVNAGLAEDSTIRVYFSADDASDWSMQLFGGHWGDMIARFDQDSNPSAPSDGYVTLQVTPEIFTNLTTKQWWGSALIVQGKGLTITEITFQ